MSFNDPTYHSNTATLYSAALDEGDYHSWSDSMMTWLMGLITPFPEKMRINRAFVKDMYTAFNNYQLENVLDIGAGPLPRGYEWAPDANILCVDHNPGITAHARSKLPKGANIRYETSSVKALPGKIKSGVADGFYSDSRKIGIGSNAVLMFVDDDEIEQTFKFLYNWCESGSVIRITTTAITAKEDCFRAGMIRRFFKMVNAPMHIRNIDNFVKLLGPWRVNKGPMPAWQWLNWPPSKNTAGIGFDIYGIELIKD